MTLKTVLVSLHITWIAVCEPLPNEREVPAENYFVRPGDTLSMNIFQEDDMETTSRVPNDGYVHFPLIGAIHVAGKSLPELRANLFEKYNKDYFVNPQLSLQIVDYAERRIRVRGHVSRPGFVIIPPEEEFTLLDAIASAGDIGPGGNERKIELHRTLPDGTEKIFSIDLTSPEGIKAQSQIPLRENDVILVPERRF